MHLVTFKPYFFCDNLQAVLLMADPMHACPAQVLRRLDNIDESVRQFFLPAAKLVLQDGDPEDALSRALAGLSGLVEVPKPRRCVPLLCLTGWNSSSVTQAVRTLTCLLSLAYCILKDVCHLRVCERTAVAEDTGTSRTSRRALSHSARARCP